MQMDFHYYATYCAAYLAGYSHDESMEIAYSAQLVDLCSRTFLMSIKGPLQAATTQLQLELADAMTDIVGLQDITRIWASFHFLPHDLNARVRGSKLYKNKFRLICDTNGELVLETVKNAKDNGTQAAGIAMHVLADTWAHRYFAGTPSLVINNINYHFYEIMPDKSERRIKFRHSASAGDDIEEGLYTASIYRYNENSIMNLGHGRAGHFPDYCFARYRYLPAWGDYEEIIKDNPSDYMNAFCQMIYALKYLHGDLETFERDKYDREAITDREDEINRILNTRQPDACKDWKALGEKLSGREICDFDLGKYTNEYLQAGDPDKDDTFLGRFILSALRQKSMVTNRIYKSGNLLAGYSIDYKGKPSEGLKDFIKLTEIQRWEK